MPPFPGALAWFLLSGPGHGATQTYTPHLAPMCRVLFGDVGFPPTARHPLRLHPPKRYNNTVPPPLIEKWLDFNRGNAKYKKKNTQFEN